MTPSLLPLTRHRLATAAMNRTRDVYLNAEGRLHARLIRFHIPQFPTDRDVRHAERELSQVYDHYVKLVSPSGMAASLATSSLLLALCRTTNISTAIDLGSGFSSYVFHHWAAESGARICSVDDSEEWLGRTQEFLALYDFEPARVCLWPDIPSDRFELVFHDLSQGERREAAMQIAADSASRFVVFDDAQHRGHRIKMKAVSATSGLALYSLRSLTLDNIHRYAALGFR